MKRQNAGAVILSAAVAFVCSGCATLMSGTTQKLAFKSNPPGAKVSFANQRGTTPVTLNVKKGHSEPVSISHGSNKRLVVLTRKIDPMTWFNLIPPLWPGFIVDAISGAITKYDAEVITMDFDNNKYRLTKFGR